MTQSGTSNALASDLDHILAHTRELWEELRCQRVFLTGATGFFGTWLMESFVWACDSLDLKAEAVLLTRRPEAFARKAPHLAAHPAVQLHRGDVRSFDFPPGPFSHVIHAATESCSSLNEDDPLLMIDTIVAGTQRALEFAQKCKATKFLFTSSGAVYGRQPTEITHVPEDYAGGPNIVDQRSAYGEGKRLAELLCVIHARRHGLQASIARCFALVGPFLPLDIHFAMGNFIRDGMAGGPIRVQGDGTAYRSYLYAADLAIWLWSILLRGRPARPYNVGSEDELTIAELSRRVGSHFQPPCSTIVAKQPQPGAKPERYVPSTARARSELGLRQTIELDDAIRRTVCWNAAKSHV
jgi:dTDP-glucose 4,6-dehydratase